MASAGMEFAPLGQMTAHSSFPYLIDPKNWLAQSGEKVMFRASIFMVSMLLASMVAAPPAEAKKGGGGKWKGPPPHGNAYGHYKNGKYNWSAYPYWSGYSPAYAPSPPPAYYGWPPPYQSGFDTGYAVPPAMPEPLPPPPPVP
jgi:hypothetical protein